MYRTFVVGYHPKAKEMAAQIEKESNALARRGYRVVSFSITGSGKAIILAQEPDAEAAGLAPDAPDAQETGR